MVLYLEEWFSTDRNGYLSMERNVFNQEEWFPTISAKSIEGTHELNGTDTKTN